MDDRSRIIRLKYDLIRDELENEGTRAVPVPAVPEPSWFEQAYRAVYPRLRRVVLEHRKPGLLVAALGEEDLQGSLWLEAKAEELNTAIVGRHTSADLFLPMDPSLSLRHLAILVQFRASGRFRILDLRTPMAFADEEGRPLEAIASDGPVIVRCGACPLVAFPTPSPESFWPDDAGEAWPALPPRVYLEERGSAPPGAGRPDRAEQTVVFSTGGPILPDVNLVEDGEPLLGELELELENGRCRSMRVGRGAAKRGLLLGRYERCDNDEMSGPTDESISRVHVLILEIDGVMHAIDTASSNGIYDRSRRVRTLPLTAGRTVGLAGDRVRVAWRPAH